MNDNINWYPGHMAKTKRELKEKIKLIDVVYEVMDARMPYSTKMQDMEDILRDKPRILVFTKKDLCDLDVTKKWLDKYERDGFKTVLLDLTNDSDYKTLVKLTKEITKDLQEDRSKKGLKDKELKIGVIGVPNVGKSTLINKLAGKKVASTANKPGVTKQVNWLRTKEGFLVLDTPGILWPKLDENDVALNLASTATIKTDLVNMTDIGGFLVAFLKNHYPEILKNKYGIELSENPLECLERIADKLNYKDKDGYLDYEKASLKLYNDLVSGSIKGVTLDTWI